MSRRSYKCKGCGAYGVPLNEKGYCYWCVQAALEGYPLPLERK